MKPARNRNDRKLSRAGFLWILAPALALTLFAARGSLRAPRVPARVRRAAQAAAPNGSQTYTAYCGLWRTDGGFHSTIQIKNELVVAPIDVTPILYLQDGTELDLPPVRIPTAGAALVDINQALAEYGRGLDRRFTERGSAAIQYSYHSPGHVLASMRILDLKKSLIFVFPFNPVMTDKPGPQTLEAVWWRPDIDTRGFLTFANATDQPLAATFVFTGASGAALPAQSVSLPPHGSRTIPLLWLLAQLPPDQRGAGGVTIAYSGAQGALIFAGGLETERTGFSATMPAGGHLLTGKTIAANFASAGLMVGRPMAGMGFPLSVSFRPYLVLRNTTGRALPVALRLNWMEGEAPRTLPLPTQVLAPAATRRVHLGQLMDRAGLGDFDGSVNLLLSFNGRAGDLVPAAGSMDETHNYVFEVPPQGAAPTSGREAITWQLRAGFDTMLTLWNWGEKAEDVVATFYYGDGTGKYELPEHLAAGASATIDLMQLAESGQPDASGQTFSMSPGYGSATFETADGKHGWMDLAEAAGVYNPVTATCGVVCVTCCGYGSVGIDPNQLILQLQADGYPVADGEYCDGTVTDFSGTWSSSDTRIATVAAGGPPVQGVGVGQADVTAYLTNVPVNAGQICAATDPSCPPPYNPEPTGGVNVTPAVSAQCNSATLVMGQGSGAYDTGGTCSGTGAPSGGTFSWSVNKGTLALSPGGTNGATLSYTAAAESSAPGDTSITVTYTVGTQSSSATLAGFTVRKPTSLVATKDTLTQDDNNCPPGEGGYPCGARRFIWYQLSDSLGPINVSGVPVAESWAAGSNTCGTPEPQATVAYTDSTGAFQQPDQLSLCSTACSTGACPAAGSCSLTATQAWSANGYPVLTNSVSFGCKSISVNGH